MSRNPVAAPWGRHLRERLPTFSTRWPRVAPSVPRSGSWPNGPTAYCRARSIGCISSNGVWPGAATTGDRLSRLRDLVEARPACKVVLTCYADHLRAGSPPPDEVCHHAIVSGASVLLIDTWSKDGTRLLDWLPRHALERLIETSHDAGVRVALGGSLGRRDIETVLPLHPDWVAIRGAACVQGRRDGPLDPPSVSALVDLLR